MSAVFISLLLANEWAFRPMRSTTCWFSGCRPPVTPHLSSSSTSSRFCFTPYVFWLAALFVFLKYLFKNARKHRNAPDLLREVKGGWPRGCHTSYFPIFCPCKVSGPWSCRPQSLGSGGDATPCEGPRQEHGPQLKFEAGCLLIAAAHDVARPPGPTGLMWASEQSDTRHAHRGGEYEGCRVRANPTLLGNTGHRRGWLKRGALPRRTEPAAKDRGIHPRI